MNNKTEKPTLSKIEILGGYQILGGLFGVGLTIYLLSSLSVFPIQIIIISLIAFALYGYSILCGFLILKNKISGLKYSRINQFLQIFSFLIFGYGFTYASGVFFNIGVDFTDDFQLAFNFGISNWQITWNHSPEISMANFNIVAFLILIFIEKKMKELDRLTLDGELKEIGNDNN